MKFEKMLTLNTYKKNCDYIYLLSIFLNRGKNNMYLLTVYSYATFYIVPIAAVCYLF